MSDTGSMNCTLPSLISIHPDQKDAYMIVARDLLQGVDALATKKNISASGCALIATHALECALKAFLWHKGKKKVRWYRKNGHKTKSEYNAQRRCSHEEKDT